MNFITCILRCNCFLKVMHNSSSVRHEINSTLKRSRPSHICISLAINLTHCIIYHIFTTETQRNFLCYWSKNRAAIGSELYHWAVVSAKVCLHQIDFLFNIYIFVFIILIFWAFIQHYFISLDAKIFYSFIYFFLYLFWLKAAST